MKANTQKVLNITDHVTNKKISLLCFFVDAEKAFDRLKWALIKEMVQKMGLGVKLLSWLKAVYKEPQAIIRVNDLNSDPILLRGVWKGCPLSPLLSP